MADPVVVRTLYEYQKYVALAGNLQSDYVHAYHWSIVTSITWTL